MLYTWFSRISTSRVVTKLICISKFKRVLVNSSSIVNKYILSRYFPNIIVLSMPCTSETLYRLMKHKTIFQLFRFFVSLSGSLIVFCIRQISENIRNNSGEIFDSGSARKIVFVFVYFLCFRWKLLGEPPLKNYLLILSFI